MSYSSGTIGGTQYAGPSSSYGSGTDYMSPFAIQTADAIQTGAIAATASTENTNRPIRLTSFTFYFRSSASGNAQIQVASSASGTGRSYASVTSGDLSYTFRPSYTAMAGDKIWGGFRKTNGSTVYWYREKTSSNLSNQGYGIYRDGTLDTSFSPSDTSSYFAVAWNTVPSSPQSLAVSNKTSTSITLSWSAPASDGGDAINGYRILYRPYTVAGNGTWSVFTGGKVGNGTTTSYTITGLSSGVAYDFKVAATNATSDAHNATYPDSTAETGSNATLTNQSTISGPKVRTTDWSTRAVIKTWDNSLSWAVSTARVYDPTYTDPNDGTHWRPLT